jgi:hypothetical protein
MAELSERFWNEQAKWSRKTFGSDEVRGPLGPLKHLAKEVAEVIAELEKDADDAEVVMELADCQFLIFDAARRFGLTHGTLFAACFAKLEINRNRQWGTAILTEPIEHVR